MIKPKVLAFPGWGTNATIMQFQMGSLHDYLSQYIEIQYVDPPYPVLRAELPEEYQKFIDENQSLFRWGDKTLNFHDDIQRLQKRLKEDPNIVGFIGFSQGTILEQLIAQIAMNNPSLKKQIKFMIFFSANGIKMPQKYYDKIKLIQIPSLHTIGKKDWLNIESLIQTTEFLNPILIYTDAKFLYLVLNNRKLYFNLLQKVWQSIKVIYENICNYISSDQINHIQLLLIIMIHDLENQYLLHQICLQCLHISLSKKPLGIVSQFDPILQIALQAKNNTISSCKDCYTSKYITIRKFPQIQIYQLQYCSQHKNYKIHINCDTCQKIQKQTNYYQCVKCFNYYNISFLENQQCPICYHSKCYQCQQSGELFQQQSGCIKHCKNNIYRYCAIYVYFAIYFTIFLLVAIFQLAKQLFKEVIVNLSQIDTKTNLCVVFIYYPILLFSQILFLVLAFTFLVIPFILDYLIRKFKEIRTSCLEGGFYSFNVNSK